MTSVEVVYAYVQPTYLLKVWSDIRVKSDFMPQAELLFFQNGGLFWHGVQKQNDEPIKMACGDKSRIRDLLIFTIPFP